MRVFHKAIVLTMRDENSRLTGNLVGTEKAEHTHYHHCIEISSS